MEGMISAALPYGYGALTALVTRYHSNVLVERRHMLEAHSMKTTKSRSCSRVATFLSILLATVLVATGCAQKVVPVEGPQVSMMLKTNFTSSEYDASSLLLWNIGQNTLQSSDTSVVHVSDFNNGEIL